MPDRIDEILESFEVVETTHLYAHENDKDNLKAVLRKEIIKGKIKELEVAVQQYIFNTKSNPHNFSEYAHNRIAALRKELEE